MRTKAMKLQPENKKAAAGYGGWIRPKLVIMITVVILICMFCFF
jgi:hypothetical protein